MKKLISLIVIMSLMFLVSGCGGTSSTKEELATLYGYISIPDETITSSEQKIIVKSVKQTRNTIPLQEASVYITGTQSLTASTDKNGYFELNLKPGKYEVLISHPQYVSILFKVTLYAGQKVNASERLGTFHYIVVDIGDYPGTEDDLSPGPEKDAELFLNTISQNNFWVRSITHVENENATVAGIKAAIDKVKNVADWQDYIVFYYSGHGTQVPDLSEPDGYSEAIYVYDHYITDDMLEAWFKDFKTQDIAFIFDSCYSGGMTKNINIIFENKSLITKDLNQDGYVVLMASDSDEYSWQFGDNGVFTDALCQGINTKKADANKDGIITAIETFNYAAPIIQCLEITIDGETFTQNPQIWDASHNILDIPLVRYQ